MLTSEDLIAAARSTRRSIRSALIALHFPQLHWNEPIGLDECPYARRWVLDFGAFTVRLHRWLASDDTRAKHDHAWWFLTCVLWGGYLDVTRSGADRLSVGSIRFRSAEHQHTVVVDPGGALTLVITGAPLRRWGFWVDGRMVKRDKYFATHGHHPCDFGQPAVRLRPDGSRI